MKNLHNVTPDLPDDILLTASRIWTVFNHEPDVHFWFRPSQPRLLLYYRWGPERVLASRSYTDDWTTTFMSRHGDMHPDIREHITIEDQ